MIHYKNSSKSQGFTLVELVLAMLFISALLLAIGGLVIQVGTVFAKGITMRAVNEAGQLVSSDMQRTFNSSSSASFKKRIDNSDVGGRVCIGGYVYAWNQKGGNLNTYTDMSTKPIRLVKFKGNPALYCPATGPFVLQVPATDAIDLLSTNESNLFVKQLAVNSAPVLDDPNQVIYTISIGIGTSDAVIRPAGCVAPQNVTEDQYCGINTFTFTARAGNAL